MTMRTKWLRIAGMLLWATGAAVAVYFASVRANNQYYARNPILGDTASYWMRDGAFERIADKMDASAWQKRSYIIDLNPKDPLRTFAYAFMSPDAPYAINGHLPYAACAVFLFVFTFSLLLLHRTHSLPYALAAPLVLFTAAGFFNPMYGMPSKLPDMTASMLMASALFILFAGIGRRREWLWIFSAGLLLGVATLARYHVWIYGLFVMGPIVFLLGCKHYMAKKDWRWVAGYPALLLAGLALVAGWFIWAKTADMIKFYSVAGYSLNGTVLTALQTTGRKFFTQFLGSTGLITLGFMALFFWVLHKPTRNKNQLFDAALVAWAVFSYFILALGIMKVDDIIEQSYYAIGGLLIGVLTPFILVHDDVSQPAFRRYSRILLLWLPIVCVFGFKTYTGSESFLYPRSPAALEKTMQSSLAQIIGEQAGSLDGDVVVADSDFQYYTRFLTPIVRAKYGKHMEYPNIFQIRESQWQLFADRQKLAMDIPIIAEGTYQALTEKTDIYLALTVPLADKWVQAFADEYTRDVSRRVNAKIAKQPEVWQAVGSVDGPYGKVVVYKNRLRFGR